MRKRVDGEVVAAVVLGLLGFVAVEARFGCSGQGWVIRNKTIANTFDFFWII